MNPGRYRYSFTGPCRLSIAELALVPATVRRLLEPAEITTGGAHGWDLEVARLALTVWPDAHHRIVCPGAPHALFEVAELEREHPGLEVVRLAEGFPLPKAYRIRNEALVGYGDSLVAAVRGLRFYRSGECMTVNIARRAGVPIDYIDLLTPA